MIETSSTIETETETETETTRERASKRGVGAVADALAKRGAGLSPRPVLTFSWNL